MGFIHANIIPIIKEGVRQPYVGRVLLLGQGDIYFNMDYLRRISRRYGLALDESIPVRPSHAPVFASKGYPHCESVFRMLGFSEISVLDYSAFEGADVVFDLNSQDIPEHLEGSFDVLIDHGTLEHVFDLPTALNNIFRFLKVGGRAIFSAPSGNFFDHGFYMLQPTLFCDWLTANNWQIESLQVAQFSPNQEVEPCFFTDYEPGLFESLSYGKLDNKLYATVCVATKTESSTGNICPQQGLYARQEGWGHAAAEVSSTKLQRTYRIIKRLHRALSR